MIFRVCKKIAKVIYLNGGKGKLRTKKCKFQATKIESFVRKGCTELDEYKEKIKKLVYFFDKHPENVKNYVLKYS